MAGGEPLGDERVVGGIGVRGVVDRQRGREACDESERGEDENVAKGEPIHRSASLVGASGHHHGPKVRVAGRQGIEDIGAGDDASRSATGVAAGTTRGTSAGTSATSSQDRS